MSGGSTEDMITILSSDTDVQEVQAGNNGNNTDHHDDPSANVRRVPLQRIATGKEIFSEFLEKCQSNDKSSEMEKIVKKLWKRFNEAEESYTKSKAFKELVFQAQGKVEKGLYSTMKTVSDELSNKKKSQMKPAPKDLLPSTSTSSTTTSVKNENGDVDPKTILHINKLEKILVKLHKRIQKLENIEVDLNSSDEENSAYIQVTRYKTRFCQVFQKLCEMKKKDPHAERVLMKNIKFSATQIPEVDKAIEKFYNNQREFPDYRDILTVVKKANEIKKLNLSPAEINNIALKAFQELGKTLKKYRQLDDIEIFRAYLSDNDDPASTDTRLKETLEENKKKYGNRIDEIIDKYAVMQDEEPQRNAEINTDVEEEESENEEYPETDMESRDSIFGSRSDLEESTDEVDLNRYPDCRVVLVDVRNTPAWEQYVTRNQEIRSPDKYPVIVIENSTPLFSSHKRSSSDLEDNSDAETATDEPVPSTSKQEVPIKLGNFRHLKRAKLEKHTESTRDKPNKLVIEKPKKMSDSLSSTDTDTSDEDEIYTESTRNKPKLVIKKLEKMPDALSSSDDDTSDEDEISFSNNIASSTRNFAEENADMSPAQIEPTNDVPTLESSKKGDSTKNSMTSSAPRSKSKARDDPKDEPRKGRATSKSPKDITPDSKEHELHDNIDPISDHFMSNGVMPLEVVLEEDSSATSKCGDEHHSRTAKNMDNEDIVVLDEIAEPKTPTKVNGDIIDVEELDSPEKTVKVASKGFGSHGINLSQIIRNMNFKKETLPKIKPESAPQNRMMPGPSNAVPIMPRSNLNQNRPTNTRNTVFPGYRQMGQNNAMAFPKSANKNPNTMRPNPYMNSRPTSNGRHFGSMQSRNVQNVQYFTNNANVTMKSGQAAMQRRQVTQRTTQTYDAKTNRIITRKETTTVLQQSVMQVGVVGQNQRMVNHQMRQVNRQRISSNRNSSDDVITLD